MTLPEHLYEPLPPFHPSAEFSLGVEEELHLVAPTTLAPDLRTDALLTGEWPPGQAKGEICDGVIEFVTPISANTREAVTRLGAMRAEAVSRGAGLIGAGLHPDARFGDVRHRRGRRYAQIGDTMRGVMRQTPHCGVHVHVGMPDPETAVRACNAMRKWIPLLQALGANSPFWYGQDSGLASARAVISNSFPRSGIPRHFGDYNDFADVVRDLQRVGDCPDYSLIWWDVRPHPRLGTLEIRALDAQASLEDLAAVVALVHALAVHEATTTSSGPDMTPEVLRAASFAATRDGLDARVPFDGELVPVRHAAVLAQTLVGHEAAELGCWDELMLIQRLLERGNGAARQRAAAEHGMPGVLSLLARETMAETNRTERNPSPRRRCTPPGPPGDQAVPATALG
jgi:glutamate---cysteine ligase / carboxylate-amine ligase